MEDTLDIADFRAFVDEGYTIEREGTFFAGVYIVKHDGKMVASDPDFEKAFRKAYEMAVCERDEAKR